MQVTWEDVALAMQHLADVLVENKKRERDARTNLAIVRLEYDATLSLENMIGKN